MDIPKRILITGASSGVGCSLTHHLSKEFKVIVGARRKERLLKQFEDNNNVNIYTVDLSDEESTINFLKNVDVDHGFIPYLINNAGINVEGELYDLPIDEVKKSIKVNALAPLKLMKYFLGEMRRYNFGRIINITSGAPLNCFPGFGSYSGSKALLNSLTVTMAKENQKYNIKINLMSPGPVRSEMSPNSELDPSICHPMTEYLVNIGEEGPTGKFFWLKYEVPLFPDLEGVQWLEGKGNEKLKEVL